jgi:hypothetical protein
MEDISFVLALINHVLKKESDLNCQKFTPPILNWLNFLCSRKNHQILEIILKDDVIKILVDLIFPKEIFQN